MHAAAEIKVWPGEVVAVAVAEDAELEGRKQGHFDGAGQVDRGAGGCRDGVCGDLASIRLARGGNLQVEGDERCHHPLVRTGADNVPRAARIGSIRTRLPAGLVGWPGDGLRV